MEQDENFKESPVTKIRDINDVNNIKAYIKNETNLPFGEVINEVDVKRSRFINKEEFITMMTNLKFDVVSTANLTLVTGYRCLYDEKDNIKVETIDKCVNINNKYY